MLKPPSSKNSTPKNSLSHLLVANGSLFHLLLIRGGELQHGECQGNFDILETPEGVSQVPEQITTSEYYSSIFTNLPHAEISGNFPQINSLLGFPSPGSSPVMTLDLPHDLNQESSWHLISFILWPEKKHKLHLGYFKWTSRETIHLSTSVNLNVNIHISIWLKVSISRCINHWKHHLKKVTQMSGMRRFSWIFRGWPLHSYLQLANKHGNWTSLFSNMICIERSSILHCYAGWQEGSW